MKRILSTQHFNFKSFSFVCNFVAADLTSASSTRLFLFTFEFCRQAGNSSSGSIGNFESMRFLYQLFGNHKIFQNIPRISNDLHAGEGPRRHFEIAGTSTIHSYLLELNFSRRCRVQNCFRYFKNSHFSDIYI